MIGQTPLLDLQDVEFQHPEELHWPGDSPAMTAAIRWLGKAGVPAKRVSQIQIKVGPLCFYPISGTINFDNQRRQPERGLAGLKAVLERAIRRQLPPVA